MDFSCWSKELDAKRVFLDMQRSLRLWREERRSSVPRICSHVICSHWESCQAESSRRHVEISKKSGSQNVERSTLNPVAAAVLVQTKKTARATLVMVPVSAR